MAGKRIEPDGRTGQLSDDALSCRSDGRHPWPPLKDAVRSGSGWSARFIRLTRVCPSCGAEKDEEYDGFTGERTTKPVIRYPDHYLLPKPEDGSYQGRLSSVAARLALFSRVIK